VKWEAPVGGAADAVGVVPGPVREGPVSAPAGVVGDRGVRSPGSKPKRLPVHPVVAGEEKTAGKRIRCPAPGWPPAISG
jgi:hypothetical protein